jgi:hypothetical protein
VPKAYSENSAPNPGVLQENCQKRQENIAAQGKVSQISYQQREALREHNAQTPILTPKPVASAAERGLLTKCRRPEFQDTDAENNMMTHASPAALTAAQRVGPGVKALHPRLFDADNFIVNGTAQQAATPKHISAVVDDGPPVPKESVRDTNARVTPSKQAPAVVEEAVIFSAREVCDCGPTLLFNISNAHPMVTPEEKTFILGCLQAFTDIIQSEGGFREYASKPECFARDELACSPEEEPPTTQEELLRRSFETFLRRIVRNGSNSLQVQVGGSFSMGMKKVVKIEVKEKDMALEEAMSIFWDWDVRLEQKSSENEDEE